jgi:guanosine-3',5'-bis(diphosphate) 3'-pyrophosphohydrolase
MYPERGDASELSAGLNLESVALARKVVKKSVGGVRVQGESDIVVRFAKCCNPVPGDAIVGFISVSRDRAVLVHARECPKSLDVDPARRLEVSWDDGVQTLRPVAVEVLSTDRPGILASISRCFTEHGVNISQAKCKTTEDRRGINTFQVMVGHVDQLKKVIRAIQALDGVVQVSRL